MAQFKKIYIAGKVTGLPVAEYTQKFAEAAKEVEALGFIAVNPIEVVNDPNATWEGAMRLCIKALADCDGLYALPCTKNSKGATIELTLAANLRMPISTKVEFFKTVKWSNTQPTGQTAKA